MHGSIPSASVKRFLARLTKKHLLILSICLIGLCIIAGFSLKRAVASARLSEAAEAKAANQRSLEASKLKEAKTLSGNSSTKSDTSATTPAQTPQPSSSATRYSISSDPRSTAYSLTPPTPPAGDFSIAITHAGQVAAGTQIGLNSVKHSQAYYGGDLLLSPSALTISKSGSVHSANTTVSIPDGITSNFPAQAWNDPNHSILFVSTDSAPTAGTSWAIHVNTIGSGMASGTYTVHLTAFRANAGDTSWQYDGFITVNIID